MGKVNCRADVIREFSQKIHELTSKSDYYNNPNIDILRRVSFLTDELLNDKELKATFEQTLSHMEDSKIKIEVFSVIRNILAHFPFYENWNEIYLNKEIATWNKPNGGQISNFFSGENVGKTLTYDVYFKLSYCEKKIKQTINVKIPSIDAGFYIKDFVSIQDLYFTFFLVDHLLEKLGIATQIYNPPSI